MYTHATQSGVTLLMSATMPNKLANVKLLLKRGADVTIQSTVRGSFLIHHFLVHTVILMWMEKNRN
jgi:hypothetical protein